MENAEDYKAFEATITADYDAQSAVERELVLRLASILWRLRRATAMETGLFEIQADHLLNYRENCQLVLDSRDDVHTLFRRAEAVAKMKADKTVAAFCVSRICLTLHSIASAAMKRRCGVKPAESHLHLMRWIGAIAGSTKIYARWSESC